MKTLILSLFMFTSCAAAKWKEKRVSFKDQSWRICSAEIDGQEYHLKGFCYWQKEVKKRVIRKDLYRRKHKVCLFVDPQCLLKFQQAGKKIK